MQGSEATLSSALLFNTTKIALKRRISKSWRHVLLDTKLLAGRFANEVKIMARALEKGVRVPAVLFVWKEDRVIGMEWIEGKTMKEVLNEQVENEWKMEMFKKIGMNIGKLHADGIIHGDLTTSNIMAKESEIIIIDFGLSFMSKNVEDMAVDLYVLEKALLSTHPDAQFLFDVAIESYSEVCNKSKVILKQFKKVQARGRKRTMLG